VTETVLVAILVGLRVVAGLVPLALRARSKPAPDATTDSRYSAVGRSIGMLIGAVLGVVAWVSTGEFVFWVLFMGGAAWPPVWRSEPPGLDGVADQ
jgi:hypothetical protein